MPDVFVYTSKENALILEPWLREGGLLALQLRKATANALNDLDHGENDVEVRLIVPEAEDNTTKVRITTVASHTRDRAIHWERIRKSWARLLANGWKYFYRTRPDFAVLFPLNELGIWPTMPDGEWFLASDLTQ